MREMNLRSRLKPLLQGRCDGVHRLGEIHREAVHVEQAARLASLGQLRAYCGQCGRIACQLDRPRHEAIIAELRDEGTAVVVVTHDPGVLDALHARRFDLRGTA